MYRGTDPFGDPFSQYQRAMGTRGRPRRFDEFYRCYPIIMLPGPDRSSTNHGGKIFLPASALDKLTTLHITYPMLFSLHNGAKSKSTHSGVLEFVAEEGRCYLPQWLMEVLALEPGDLLQVKSTDLPPGSYIKLQPQSPSFLDISDPKAVLETAFRQFSCLTTDDIFTFAYNDQDYHIKVLEVKPDTDSHAISVQETDLSVDFAEPVGYAEEMERRKAESGTSTPRSGVTGKGGVVHSAGTMAQAINYDALKSASDASTANNNFAGAGQRLVAKKRAGAAASSSSAGSSKPASPAPAAATEGQGVGTTGAIKPRKAGPQPLRLPPNKLFFGYEIKPVPKKKGEGKENGDEDEKRDWGQGQTLRKSKP